MYWRGRRRPRRYGAFAGMENDSMLDAVREAGEASLAIDVGVNLQVQLADAPCAVGDVNTDHRVVDGSSGLIGDGKVRRARADTAIKRGCGVRIGIARRSILIRRLRRRLWRRSL